MDNYLFQLPAIYEILYHSMDIFPMHANRVALLMLILPPTIFRPFRPRASSDKQGTIVRYLNIVLIMRLIQRSRYSIINQLRRVPIYDRCAHVHVAGI